MRIALVGGDARMLYAKEALALRGHSVNLCAHGEAPLSPLLLADAEVALLPHPLTRDGQALFAPLSPLPVPLAALFEMLPEGIPLLVGRDDTATAIAAKGHPLLAYGKNETYLRRTTAITAEGVLALLLEELPLTLPETPIMLLGSGRLATALAELLLGLHTPLAVFARKEAPLEKSNLRPLPLAALPAEIGRYRVIINTVPAPLFTPVLLRCAAKGTLYIELASAGTATPPALFTEAGLSYLPAPAVPGRYAPTSAGLALADAACEILDCF